MDSLAKANPQQKTQLRVISNQYYCNWRQWMLCFYYSDIWIVLQHSLHHHYWIFFWVNKNIYPSLKITQVTKKVGAKRVLGYVIKQTLWENGRRKKWEKKECPRVLHYCSCLQCNSQLFLKIQDNYPLISSQEHLFQFYKWGRNVIIFRIITWVGMLPVKPTLWLNFF